MKSLVHLLAKYICGFLILSIGITVAPQKGCADRKRDRAFKHFSQGKAHYKQKRYQSAEKSFSRSLTYVMEHQSLYYKALSIAKQGRPCEEIRSAWRTYLDFCEKKKTNCMVSWLDKAKGHYQVSSELCTTKTVPRTISGDCPKGSSLSDNRCVVSQIECPVGHLSDGQKCVSEPVCPPNMIKQGLKCVTQAPCPSGYLRQGSQCVRQNQCAIGEQMIEGIGCKPIKIDRVQSSSGHFLATTPWWGYTALGAGVLSHVINVLTNSGKVLDATFITALTGYGIATIGLGIGVYRSLDDAPSKVTTQDSSYISDGQNRAGFQEANDHVRGIFLRWSSSF